MLAARDIAKARHQCLTIDRYLSQDGELFTDSHVKFSPALTKNCDGKSVSKVVFYQTETPGKFIRRSRDFLKKFGSYLNNSKALTKLLVSKL